MIREIRHFRNLSKGLLCPCSTPKYSALRIQSTACEQKRWPVILHEAGAELLFTLAQGNIAIVHDRSARSRETRACWQGLSWMRYALFRAWNDQALVVPSEKSPRGHPLNPYWEAQYALLPRSTRHLLRHFKRYYGLPGQTIYLRSCWSRSKDMIGSEVAAEVKRLYDPRVECIGRS